MGSLVLHTLLLSLLTADKLGLVEASNGNSNFISRLPSGTMRTFIRTTGRVSHMEEDKVVPGRLLYADEGTLMTTDGKTRDVIVGSGYGYAEGRGAQARFSLITGFLQTNTSHVLMVDYDNHCIRYVNRVTYLTSQYVGTCTGSGFTDGAYTNAKFSYPWSVMQYLNNPKSAIITDSANHAVRSIDFVTGYVRTLVRSLPTRPYGVSFDPQGNALITFPNFLGKLDLRTFAFTQLTPYHQVPPNSAVGLDGEFRMATLGYGREILCKDEMCLVADEYSRKLRIVDTIKRTVTSLCTGVSASVDGPLSRCSIVNPASLLLLSDTLYIGEVGAIRSVSEFDACLKSPCLNSGICTSGDHNTYTCYCRDGWTGRNCQTEIDACTINPCKNSGRCLSANSSFTCSCTAGWTGSICEKELTNLACPKEITVVADMITMKANISLCEQDQMSLGIGQHILYRKISENHTCFIPVNVLDPRLKNRLDITANYIIPCNVLQNFEDVILAVAKARYSQIKMMSSGHCSKSADYPIQLSCSNGVLSISWPTDCVFPLKLFEQHAQTKIIKDFLMQNAGAVLDLLIPNHIPPIIHPSVNPEGLPATVSITPICPGSMKYGNITSTCY